MNWLKQLVSRRRLYGDLSEEIREHLEEKVEGLVRNGMSRKDAESAARREFGNVTLMEENARDVWRWPSIENLLHDLRYGFRMLRNNPGFSVVAILTLALAWIYTSSHSPKFLGAYGSFSPTPCRIYLMYWYADNGNIRVSHFRYVKMAFG